MKENNVRTYKGFTPYRFQRDVIDQLCKPEQYRQKKVVVVKSSRQKGKTITVANILLFYAINHNHSKNYCVSPTLKQAKEIYRTITQAIENSGVVKSSNSTDLIIVLINGSRISFKSAEQGTDALRGFTCSGILCIDEAAFIADDILHTILPWCDYHKANILMTSTPFVKSGFFWDYYNYGLEHTHNTVTIDWCSEFYLDEIRQILDEEQLNEYKSILPKNVFKTEYLGEWLDDDGSVFINFKNCIKHNSIKPTDRLYVGIDWANGGGNDDTVISMLNQYGQQVYLEYKNNLSPTQQIDWLEGILKKYQRQIVVVKPELNSIGTPYTDMLKKRLQTMKIEGFDTTNKSKNDIVSQLQVAFEQQTIEILEDEKQERELSYYAAEYNLKTKTLTFNAPKGLNDDICIALMLSYDAFIDNKTNYVHINFGNKKKHKRIEDD